MAWTDERVELLKKLWAEGLSARQIADQLGNGVTRNAVIGKVHRLGLSGRAVNVAPKQVRARARKRVVETAKPAASGSASATVTKIPNAAKESFGKRDFHHGMSSGPLLTPVDELVIPLEERVTMETLREGQCKWPIGDPTREDFHFCGRHQHGDSVYCEFHTAKAYQPARRAQKKKEPRQLVSFR